MIRSICVTLLFAAVFPMTAQAQIPRQISFQGILTDASGQAADDGNYLLTFRLYDNELGVSVLWTETQTTAVQSGVFNVMLGKETPLSLTFNKPLWLGVSVDGAQEMRPRTALAASPYALHADVANAIAPGVGGIVRSVNGSDGDVTLQGAGGTTVTRSGNTVTISSTGGTGGSGIQGVQNTDGSISVLNPSGPVATIGIADNAVVKGLSVGATTLRDNIVLQAGSNITLTPTGNTVRIEATGGGTGIQSIQNTNQTLDIINADGPVATINVGARAISQAHLADNAVIAAKIADGVITASKISSTGATPGQVLGFNGSSVTWIAPAAGGVSGSGSVNRLALWSNSDELSSSSTLVFDGGKFGVGTSTPGASLHVAGQDGVLATGAVGSGAALSLGFGERMHWYPKKAAFRVGRVTGTEWDDALIGQYSVAMGYNTTALSLGATALGYATRASDFYAFATGFTSAATGTSSTAMGSGTTASGINSTSLGSNTAASGSNSIAMGRNTTASGFSSTSIGESTTAGGTHSIAMGFLSSAGGSSSFAAGTSATASGNHSVAIGNNVSTNSHAGAFVLGCQSPSALMNSSAPNQMSMRFAGGYRLYSDIQQSKGVYMNGGVSGWTNYSDRNTKENISEIDGEALLAKIRHLSVTEWNYIGADPGIRYIGPMAQDFWKAFKLGGTDSLGINSISIDGVNLAAIKALELRTAELRNGADVLADLEETVRRQQEQLSESTERIAELEAQLSDYAAMRQEMQAIKVLLMQNGLRPDVLRASHDTDGTD
jgi:hypothetical protein